jgi:hypothetical protein
MLERVMEGNPQVQEPQAGYDASDCAIGSIDGERRVLHEKRILIPKKPGPWRVTDGQADVHAQHDAQKQFGPLKPSRNALGT